MSGKRWTPWEIDFVVKSRNPREIVEHTGRTYSAVTQFMWNHGIKARTNKGVRKLSTEQRNEVIDTYLNTDRSLQSIADEYGVCRETIRYIMNKHFVGVKR